MVQQIAIDSVKIASYQRRLRPWKVEHLAQKIKAQGYNSSYPITVDEDGCLVDGGHRVEASRRAGLGSIPCIVKPAEVSPVAHSIRCNEDGADTERHDVFDLAELCWRLTNKKMTGQEVANELGWKTAAQVTQHKDIKAKLHPMAWDWATLTRFAKPVNGNGEDAVNPALTGVKWAEAHFREFLKYLSCPNGDRAKMRAQVAAIQDLMALPDKLTAKRAGEVAELYAWHTDLAKLMTATLVKEVGISDRKSLIRNIRKNVYGKKRTDRDTERFMDTLHALNEKALGVKLYCDDAFQRIPQLADNSIHLVIADPPYNTTDHEWDKIGNRQAFIAWMKEWLDLVRPRLKAEYHLFIFCDPDYFAAIETLMEQDGWPRKSRIIWAYRNLVKGRDVTDKYIENFQVCLHFGTHALNWPPDWDDRRFAVQEHATPQSNFTEGKDHPTQKPLKLIRQMVEVGSKPGDLILDPFAGSGTTGAASSEVGQRRCVLIEREDEYCSAIERRLNIKRGQ